MNRLIFLLAMTILIISNLTAQNPEHFTWITGTWVGPGFGGTMEEVWSEPDQNGAIMGMFRHYTPDGKVTFYEFWTLDETGMKLRHFNPDMTAWEGKEEWVIFNMIKTTPNKIEMEGLVYERIGPNTSRIHLTMKTEEGDKVEVFEMTRKTE